MLVYTIPLGTLLINYYINKVNIQSCAARVNGQFSIIKKPQCAHKDHPSINTSPLTRSRSSCTIN